MSNFSGFQAHCSGSSFCIIISFFDLVITFFSFDIKKLIMIQKLESRTVGIKHTKTGHVLGITAYLQSPKPSSLDRKPTSESGLIPDLELF